MKKHCSIFTAILLFSTFFSALHAQNMGNAGYNQNLTLPFAPVEKRAQDNISTSLTVKGLYNLKADIFVAYFSLSQSGNNIAEVNRLMNERIAQVKLALEGKIKYEIVEDLISCVPVFEFEAEKKLFSKKSYNEIPKGFELKKNIHIKYFQRDDINIIFEICAASEIYDFVKTEYYSFKTEEAKKDIVAACKAQLKEKYADYLLFSGGEKSDVFKIFDEELKLFYPLESYASYTAYAQTPVYESKLQRVNYAKKEQSFYYQPFADKEFQIVVNPVITEPCIQLIYKAELTISQKTDCCEKTGK